MALHALARCGSSSRRAGAFPAIRQIPSLHVISAMFGLFQGGIVPSYALIVREHFSPQEAGARVGVVVLDTQVGMASGGWLSGKVFDLTGSYHAAFINGIGWNVLNVTIVATLLIRMRIKPKDGDHPASQ